MSGKAGRAGESRVTLLWLAAVVAAIVAGAYFLWTRDLRRGTLAPAYSTARADERGAAAIFRYYRGAGLNPRVWDRELTHLREPGLMIMLAPAARRYIVGGRVPFGTKSDVLPHEIVALDE